MRNVLMLDLLLFILIVGMGWISIDLVLQQWRAQRSQSWPVTSGRIHATEIIDPSDGPYPYGWGGYIARVHFGYIIDGLPYLSDKIAIATTGKMFHDKKLADRYLTQFSRDKTVNVYYDFKKPKFGVLEPGFSADYKASVKGNLVSLVIMITGVLIIVVIKWKSL